MSKEEPKVFLPSVPVNIDPYFLSQLENSTESDYARSQYSETYIKKKVAENLKELHKNATEHLKNNIKKEKVNLNFSKLMDKNLDLEIDLLEKKIIESTNRDKILKNQKFDDLKQNVIDCLEKNKDKPLNCWNEVKDFNKLIKDLNH